MFESYSRDQMRLTFAEAWGKHLAGSPLTPLETTIAGIIGMHPEYRAVVDDPEAARQFEAGAPAENPFLHMGLHIAVRDQVAIDRPPGIRDLRRRLERRCGDSHRAEHIMMDALAEILWEAQRSGQPPDELRYLERVRALLDARTAT